MIFKRIMLSTISFIFQVIEVGVTNVRYVALEHARPWLIHAYRNIKGRGLHKEEEVEGESVPLSVAGDPVTVGGYKNATTKANLDDIIQLETKAPFGGKRSKDLANTSSSDGESRKRKHEQLENETDKTEVSSEPATDSTDVFHIEGDLTEGPSDVKRLKVDNVSEVTDNQMEQCAQDDSITNDGNDSNVTIEGLVGEENVADIESKDIRTRGARKRKCSDTEDLSSSKSPPPTSTYDKVRLIIQPWRKPEGGINKPILKMMLESVMLFLMMRPGSTEKMLVIRYLPYIQPMVLRNIVKILEEIGCIKTEFIKKNKCSLFTKPVLPELSTVGTDEHDAMFVPTEECIFRLGQFGREFFPHAKWPSSST